MNESNMVPIAVPNVRCIKCDAGATATPTHVEGNRAVRWDPPKGWFSARYDNAPDRILYVCGGCLNGVPFFVMPMPSG
jgi:hypothetical protein